MPARRRQDRRLRRPQPVYLALCLAASLGLGASAAMAQHLALLVGNGDYAALEDVPEAGLESASAALTSQGFQVILVSDGSSRDLARALDQFARQVPEADRVLVVLQGQLVHSARDTILLPVEAPAAPDLPSALRSGIAVSALMPMLAEHQGRALLVLGTGPTAGEAGPWLTYGASAGEAANGVSLFVGPAARTSWFTVNAVARPGMRLAEAFERVEGLTASGYLPADHVFIPSEAEERTPVPLPDSDPATEKVFWEATRRADTIAGYDAYLRRYPNGPHAEEARKLAEEIRTEPNRPARLAEEAIGLTRDQRREVQRGLSLLGHDTRGVDGIFGQGTRSAIQNWQTANGAQRTGYLTREQIATILSQARSRSAQLEAEAEARRLEKERQDRAYWEQSGAVGDEAGLRSYLDRYPDGVFAAVARERLRVIEERNRDRAEARERQLWDDVRSENSPAAYRRYLERHPKGIFSDEARDRIRQIEAEAAGANDRAKAAEREAALGLNETTRQLIEGRLEGLKLEPGAADGVFDEDTRRALRRYQEARGMVPTGYVDEGTLVRLLAEVILPGVQE